MADQESPIASEVLPTQEHPVTAEDRQPRTDSSRLPTTMKVKPIVEHAQNDVQMEGAKGVRMRMLVGPEDGARSFHMRHFEVRPGGHTPHHQHDFEHEVVILKGQGVVKSDQGERPVSAGHVVWVPPNETHQFQNTGRDPLEFICLIPAPQDCQQ